MKAISDLNTKKKCQHPLKLFSIVSTLKLKESKPFTTRTEKKREREEVEENTDATKSVESLTHL